MTKSKISIILISISLFISSCSESENPGSPNPPEAIEGMWNSGEYIYTINCTEEELTFDEYINQIILFAQEYQTQEAVNITCTGLDVLLEVEEYCDELLESDEYVTVQDSIYAEEWLYTLYTWDNDSIHAAEVISDNTLITDMKDIIFNINSDMTYSISYDGVCIEENEFNETECNVLSDEYWNGTSCEILDETTCISQFVNGEWDDGSSGLLDEDSSQETIDSSYYIMDDVSSESIFEGKSLLFNGTTIYIEIIPSQPVGTEYLEQTVCVNLNFNK